MYTHKEFRITDIDRKGISFILDEVEYKIFKATEIIEPTLVDREMRFNLRKAFAPMLVAKDEDFSKHLDWRGKDEKGVWGAKISLFFKRIRIHPLNFYYPGTYDQKAKYRVKVVVIHFIVIHRLNCIYGHTDYEFYKFHSNKPWHLEK
jgi:hypothetical protein